MAQFEKQTYDGLFYPGEEPRVPIKLGLKNWSDLEQAKRLSY